MASSDPADVLAYPRYRTKIAAGLLALSLGWAGAHRWYLGHRRAWLITTAAWVLLAASQIFFASPWDNPAFLALFILAAAGFIDGLRLCLMADEDFNNRYNPGLPPRTHMGWSVVLIAVATLLIGAVVTLMGIAMTTIYVWTEMGWLDGYQFSVKDTILKTSTYLTIEGHKTKSDQAQAR